MKQEIITILLAMAPTLEAHGALATAIGIFKFSPLKAYLLSTLGSLVIVVPLLFFWHYLTQFLMRHVYFLNRFFTWLFSYTKRKHTHHFEAFGESDVREQKTFWKTLALYIFVAIPGPFTGVWAGTVAAFVFGIPFWQAALSIALGALTVGLIDLLVITGFIKLIF